MLEMVWPSRNARLWYVVSGMSHSWGEVSKDMFSWKAKQACSKYERSSVTNRTSPFGSKTFAIWFMKSCWISRRLWCRILGQGSGNKICISEIEFGSNQSRSTSIPSPWCTRMFESFASWPNCATSQSPAVCTSIARIPTWPWTSAKFKVWSPIPLPKSIMTFVRSNVSRRSTGRGRLPISNGGNNVLRAKSRRADMRPWRAWKVRMWGCVETSLSGE